MNRLSTDKRAQVLSMLVEGMSMRSASRIADVSFNTVAKLLVEAGEASSRIQCDEIWAFCYAKAKTVKAGLVMPEGGAGDVYLDGSGQGHEADRRLRIGQPLRGRGE